MHRANDPVSSPASTFSRALSPYRAVNMTLTCTWIDRLTASAAIRVLDALSHERSRPGKRLHLIALSVNAAPEDMVASALLFVYRTTNIQMWHGSECCPWQSSPDVRYGSCHARAQRSAAQSRSGDLTHMYGISKRFVLTVTIYAFVTAIPTEVIQHRLWLCQGIAIRSSTFLYWYSISAGGNWRAGLVSVDLGKTTSEINPSK